MTIFEKWARIPARQPILFYLGASAVILLLTLGIYTRTAHYGYLDWDDNTLVEQNPYVIYPPYWQHAVDLFIPGRTPGPHLPLRTASYIFDREWLGKGAPLQVPAGVAPDHVWTIPNYHHVTNIILYALNGLLLLWMLRKLLPPWAAIIATLIWVAHPLHVEGVCWVSGRKEMLAGGFVFAALLAYIYGTEALRDAGGKRPLYVSLGLTAASFVVGVVGIKHPLVSVAGVHGLTALGLVLAACVAYGVTAGGDKGWKAGSLLALSVFFSLCGALSKPVAICIPPILLAWEIGYRPRREAASKDEAVSGAPAGAGDVAIAWVRHHLFSLSEFRGIVARLAPHAVLALWGAYMTVGLAGKTQVLKEATWNAAPKSQSIASFAAMWLDIYHLVAPLDLSSLYDVKSDHWYWQAWAGIVILALIPLLAIWLLRKNPTSLLWLAFWLVPLIPVSGIWRLASAHADRYLYIPAVALAVGLGVLLATATFGDDEETGAWERIMAAILSVVIIGGFSALSYQRAGVWERDEYLWGDAVRKNPDLPSARNNYGAALMNAGKMDQALEQYYAAYKILPTLDVAQFNIAATEMRRGNVDAAVKYAEEFSHQHPEMPTGWILLGQVYTQQARKVAADAAASQERSRLAQDAFEHGCNAPVDKDAILQKQDKASACNQLAVVRSTLGDDAGALAAWDEGLTAAPLHRGILLNRSKYWQSKKETEKALGDLNSIASSGDPEVFRNFATIYYQNGNKPRALEYMDILMRSGRYTQRDVDLYNALRKQVDDEKNAPLPTPAPSAHK